MEALILYTHPSGDNSEVLCVLLKDRGTVNMFSRASRGSSRQGSSRQDTSGSLSKRSNKHKHHPEPFDYGRIFFKERPAGMPVVTDFIPETSFPSLRLTIEKLTCASLLCEALSRLIPEHCPESEKLFELAILGLSAIAEGTTPKDNSTASANTATALKALHLALYGIAIETAIIQPQQVLEAQPNYGLDTEALTAAPSPRNMSTPSSRNLLLLIDLIQRYANCRLKSLTAVEECIAFLRKTASV
jgi:hypothetical protein